MGGNIEFVYVERMTTPDETESVQTDSLAEVHRVEFEIKASQTGSKGRQATNVKH